MTGRHTGVVTHVDEETGYAEITAAQMQPISCNLADLRRCGADKLGAVVDFELGVYGPAGISGATNLTKPRSEP